MTHTHNRTYFPLLSGTQAPIYLDYAAQTPIVQDALDAMQQYYTTVGANVARGLYPLAQDATDAYAAARTTMATFIGADPDEVIFTSGTTGSIALLAAGLAPIIPFDAAIAVTAADHHSNIVPWQQLCAASSTASALSVQSERFIVLPLTEDGVIDPTTLHKNLPPHTAILALPLISNTLGARMDIAAIARAARSINPEIIIAVDAAQAAGHIPLDVHALDCDFLACGAHKMYGPTGVGILYGRRAQLARLVPPLTGGGMISHVSARRTTFQDIPSRLEAGTPPIAEAIGMAAAARFLMQRDRMADHAQEQELLAYLYTRLKTLFGDTLTFYGPHKKSQRYGLLSFTIAGTHPHDLADLLGSQHAICIRAGAHCAQILHNEVLGTGATARISVGIPTTRADCMQCIDALTHIVTRLTTSSL